ncbi:6239_t:CDS:10 [Diversispora eburnea]|uniref:6239_t:CDS:1 n=1 Tax=Diversispora eburnea TaxID=1213867 RepID=A0A9N9AWM3_9GLOM|nr:6239_t:CDS:10 [Diversispora eburnea]
MSTSSSSWIDPRRQNLTFHDNDDESLAIQLQQQFDEDLAAHTNNDEDKNFALLLQQQFDENLAIHTQNNDDDNEDKKIAMQLQLQLDEDFAHIQNTQNQTPAAINDLGEDENIAIQLQKQFDEDFVQSQVPATINDLNEDENIAMRLQQQFDSQSQVPATTNNSDEDRRLAMQLQQQLELEEVPATSNNFDEDRRLAMRLQQQLEENSQREEYQFDEDLGREEFNEGNQTKISLDLCEPLIFIVLLITNNLDVTFPGPQFLNFPLPEIVNVSNGEIVSEDLSSIIQGFKEKLEQEFPEATVKKIKLRTRNKQLMWTEFIAAIKNFNEIDFIKRPKISFLNEPAIDASGVFNDTIRQILEMFMSLENPEYGGDGHLFIGDSTKIISNTAPIDFMDELDVFGDILFLAIIHEAPFPTDLDITLFKHCLDLKNSISLDDLKNINLQKYNLVKELQNANPETNLSTIVGFDEWAEEKEITPVQKRMFARSKENLQKLAKQICEDVLINSRITQLNAIKKKLNKFGFFDILKAKQVKIEQIKECMYQEVMTPDDIIHRLVPIPNLNEKQNNVMNWLIEWLRRQGKDKLQEFCRLATGFTHPRNEIKITFKSTFFQESPDVQLTPKFETCSQEIKLSENFSSREELFKTMNAQVNATNDNENFTVV